MSYERLEAQLDLITVANERYGLHWPRDSKPIQIHCPMHDDRTPSARLYSSERGGYCWTCQRPITPVSLVSSMESVSYAAAAEILSGWYGVSNDLDPDEEDVRQLLRLAEHGREEEGDLHRRTLAALCARRAVGRPWGDAQDLLLNADKLLSGRISVEAFLDQVILTTRQPLC